jgi:EmrB/QacA subfamily drug resistance transporter
MTVAAESAGVAYGSKPGRWVLLVAVLGSGMAFLDSTVVNVALPTIGRDLGASTSALQWISDGYLLSLASLILLGGSLGDRYGRRRIFVTGVILFSAASLLCALAPTVEILIAARVIQGVGGALLTPGSLAMIESTFRAQDRPRAIGAWSGLTGIASALGPLIGGYLVDAVSWRAVFLLNLPLGAIVVASAHHVPETRDPNATGRLDVPGAVLGALALAGTTYALIEGPGHGMTGAIAFGAAIGVVALVGFIVVERDSANPMVPLKMFASKTFTAANIVTFAVYGALGGMFFLLVSFLQISMGYSPIQAGAALLPQTAIMLLLSARAGALAQRIGPRLPLTIGPIMIAIAMLMMTRINPGDSYAAAVLPAVVIFGLGLTLVASPVTATVLAAADPNHAGIASGINNAVSRVASLLVVAALPLVARITGSKFYKPSAMTPGFHTAMFACAGLALVGGIVAWFSISDDALASESGRRGEAPVKVPTDYHCSVAGPPWRTSATSSTPPPRSAEPAAQPHLASR